MYIVVEVTMKMARIWRSQQPEYVNFVKFEDLKVIFLTETKCKICFIYVRFSCKKNNGVKKMDGKKCH